MRGYWRAAFLIVGGIVCACAAGSAAPPPDPAPATNPTTPPSVSPPAARPQPPPAPSRAAPAAPTPRSGFPTPDELDDLGSEPPPVEIFRLDVIPVDEWRLEGPFPERVGALVRPEQGPWDGLLAEAVARRAGLAVATEGMHCVARELGRFFLAHEGQPSDGLRRFIASRCHSSVSEVGFGYVDARPHEATTDEQIFDQLRGGVAETVRQSVAGGPRAVGIWFGREGERAVAMVAFGERALHLEPFSPFADADGRLVIEGEALGPVARMTALVNRGRFGVEACEFERELPPPRFRIVCQVDRDDPSTHVALSLTPPDRVLSQSGLMVLAWPSKRTEEMYRRPRLGKEAAVFDVAEVPGTFVGLLNGVRRKAGLAAVELDTVQSRAASELAPHFFAAVFSRAPSVYADLVVLGMIAGWGVDGIVQSGHFAAAWAVRTTDLGELLATALEYPVSREALLAPDIDRIAIGPLLETTQGQQAVAAVFGTYSLFSGESHQQFAEQVYARLEAARARQQLGAPERLEELTPLCQQAASAVENGMDPADAMNGLLQGSAQRVRRTVSGWVAEVTDLDDLEFPKEYLEDPSFEVAVAVSHRKPEGEPWGRYVVMLVVADPELFGT